MSDLISRQMVLRCIKELRDNVDWGQSEDGDAFQHYTGTLYRSIASEECLPSVEPERKGKWIEHENPKNVFSIECSECGCWFLHEHLVRNSFCPNCGAKMSD